MKQNLTFLFLLIQITTFANVNLSGYVLDEETLEPMIGVNLTFTQNGLFVNGTATDSEGYFERANLKEGKYEITYSYIGYSNKIETVEITASSNLENYVLLQANAESLEEIIVVGFNPLSRSCCRCSRKTEFHKANTSLKKDAKKPLKLLVYPNPTSDYINVSSENSIQQIALINTNGQLLSLWKGDDLRGFQINMTVYPSGNYLIQILDNGEKENIKFVVTK